MEISVCGKVKTELTWAPPRVSAAIVAKETPEKRLSRAWEDPGLRCQHCGALSHAVWRAEGMVCMQCLCFPAEHTSPLGPSEAAQEALSASMFAFSVLHWL